MRSGVFAWANCEDLAVATTASTHGLDHLVYGVPDLLEGVRRVHELTGVEPVSGGRHEQQGTANYLLSLGGSRYLEIIGPDPAGVNEPGWFGLAGLRTPKLLTWAVRSVNIDADVRRWRAAGYDPGPVTGMSRSSDSGDTLTWRLTPDTVEARGGVIPFLIDWGNNRHPTEVVLPQLELRSFIVLTPTPKPTAAAFAALDMAADLERAIEPGLRCVLETPAGQITLH